MGLDIDSYSYELEKGYEPSFEPQEQDPLESQKQEVQEVQKAPVEVMEMNEFYKTEIGQKVLAEPYNKRYGNTIENDADNTYAIRRNDRYFLVRGSCAQVFPGKRLTINKDYFIYPIRENGKVDENNTFWSSLNILFDYEDRFGKIVLTPDPEEEHINLQKRISMQLHKGGKPIPDNLIFNKFIAPDPYWFECATHTVSRKQVLKGEAGTSIFAEAKHKAKTWLEKEEAKQNPYVRGIRNRIKNWLLVRKINDYIKEC